MSNREGIKSKDEMLHYLFGVNPYAPDSTPMDKKECLIAMQAYHDQFTSHQTEEQGKVMRFINARKRNPPKHGYYFTCEENKSDKRVKFWDDLHGWEGIPFYWLDESPSPTNSAQVESKEGVTDEDLFRIESLIEEKDRLKKERDYYKKLAEAAATVINLTQADKTYDFNYHVKAWQELKSNPPGEK